MHLCIGTTPTVQLTMSFEHVELDQVNRAKTVRRTASGKPINVARVLTTIGENTVVCIPVGSDTGRFLISDMDAAEIGHDCFAVKSPTRTCATVIEHKNHTATELIEEHGPLSSDECHGLLQTAQRWVSRCKTVVLSGSLAAGIPDDFYAQICRIAAEAKVPVILDARGAALKLALSHRPMIVKPNRQELEETLGVAVDDDVDLRKAMVVLHDMGAQWVVVTMGRNGAMLTDGVKFWKIPAISIDVVSAIGSGDAFAAGLAAAISRGRDVPDACRLATACAAGNALISGAGFVRLEDVRRLERLVRIEPLT
ncbi:MAG: hexose kinase [Tepidisphaeraceae bacterium]|jgi:tagatose 6-phosphate kinase